MKPCCARSCSGKLVGFSDCNLRAQASGTLATSARSPLKHSNTARKSGVGFTELPVDVLLDAFVFLTCYATKFTGFLGLYNSARPKTDDASWRW